MLSSLRRFSGARQKVGATIAALVLGAGVALVAAPLSASAHTATLSGVSACTTSTGEATITWTLDNDYNEVLNVTSSDNAAIPKGTTVAATNGGADTTKTFTQKVAAPAAGKTVSATLNYEWTGDSYKQTGTPITVTVGKDCTAPTPPTTCVTVLWEIPGGDTTKPFAVPQTIVDHKAAACGDLTVITPPDTCKAYQVDSYVEDSATNGYTDALIKGGVLKGSGNPTEVLETSVSPSYKTIPPSTSCTPEDAKASANVTTKATCAADGSVDFELTNATWQDANDKTDGSRVAVADANHLFANGTDHLTVTYTYPSQLTGLQCYPTDAAAAAVVTNGTCTTEPSVDFTLQNATWQDANDKTDGSRVAVADANHAFPGNKATLTVDYTKPTTVDKTTCYPKDATASATIATAATCTTAGTVDFNSGLVNATWQDANDISDGLRTAVATTGHLFSNGQNTEDVKYTFPAQLTNCDATATVSAGTAATCAAPGTVTFDNPVNATWDDAADVTDGSRTATATTGHLFANGTSTATVTYTIPSQLTNCAVVPPVTPPVVSPPTVNPPTVTPATTVTKVAAPTVTPEKTTTTKTVAPSVEAPSVLASTGMNDSTPIAGTIALFGLLFGLTVILVTARHRRKTSGE
jgi:hypothetical protein